MTTYLLDANVLIALTIAEHEHHVAASTWAAGVDGFVLCPVVEGALIRYLIRTGETARAAQDLLSAVSDRRGYHFWPDSVSYNQADVEHVRGHRQVTDAYLVSLAGEHPDARLATLDQGLVQVAGGLTIHDAETLNPVIDDPDR